MSSAAHASRLVDADRFAAALRVEARPQSGAVQVALACLTALTLVSIAAPFISPYRPEAYSGASLMSPSLDHLLGTNDVGQDLLSALLFGSRVSMAVAVVAGGAGLGIALLVALPAGTIGGAVDAAIMRVVDVLMAVPHLPLMILLAAFLGPGIGNVILVITLLAWVRPARVIRSQLLSLRTRGYIQSSRLLGGGWGYLMRRHLIPALTPILISSFVALAGRAVILEAALAFLGIGDPTVQSWGMIMRHALNYRGIYLTSAWLWWLMPPGLCLSILIASLAMVGTAAEGYANARLVRHHGAF